MKWQTKFCFVLLSSVLAAGQVAPAAAEPAKGEYQSPHMMDGVQIADKGNGKFKGRGNRNKIKTSSLFGSRINYASGGPPPWAPAHGYRHKYAGGSGGYKLPFGMNLGNCNRTLIGTVIGGVGGGVIGSTIGKGSGNTLAIIGGTILGAIVGAGVGDTMDNLDQNCVGQTLEHAPDGKSIEWNSPASNTDYQVTPTKSYQDASGRYCREYQTNATIDGRTQKIYGTSCRQPDGSWKLVS
jgi:surface antigen